MLASVGLTVLAIAASVVQLDSRPQIPEACSAVAPLELRSFAVEESSADLYRRPASRGSEPKGPQVHDLLGLGPVPTERPQSDQLMLQPMMLPP